MRIKYYLRGLGCGIIFSVIIMTISFGNRGNKNISDAEIIQRAKQLGMVESDETDNSGETKKETENGNETEKETQKESENRIPVVEDGTEEGGKNNQVDKKDKVSENTQEKSETNNKSDTNGNKDTEKKNTEKDDASKDDAGKNSVDKVNKPVNTNTPTNTSVNDKKPGETKPEKTEYVTITIRSGQVCREIAEDLQKKEIIDNAESFRVFMGQKGYASNIKCGTFKVPKGVSYQELAEYLVNK